MVFNNNSRVVPVFMLQMTNISGSSIGLAKTIPIFYSILQKSLIKILLKFMLQMTNISGSSIVSLYCKYNTLYLYGNYYSA